jgi:GT2 family glycosyltransferase
LDNNSQPSITVQCVLYNNDLGAVERALASLNRSAELSMSERTTGPITMAYGDASPRRTVSDEKLAEWAKAFGALELRYEWFGENTGSARGHNVIARHLESDYVLIMNPDVVVAPRAIPILLGTFDDSMVGMVEAKQLPIEHPKDYNITTGETAWATTACALIPSDLFKELDGFDADTFFMYCDDVDFSWRVRLAGRTVIFQPAATVFHDKRLGDDGAWQPSSAEQYYSAEAGLLLPYKWSRDDLVAEIADFFRGSTDQNHLRAVAEFDRRLENGLLPEQLDGNHDVARFISTYEYAIHRYVL